MPDNDGSNPLPTTPQVLTKEMIEKLKDQLDQMEGKEITEGSAISHKPGVNATGWYIAYST